MDWLKPSLFVVVFMSGFLQARCGRAYSNSEVVQLYERCILNKLSRSRFFTEEDKLRMVKIAKETNKRMNLLHLDPTNTSNMRTILRLFAASLASLVADNHIPENFQRKEVYLHAIELCSLSLPELIVDELIQEITLIFSSMRNDQHLYAVNSGNESPIPSQRRKRSLETLPNLIIIEDNLSKMRYRRTPQDEMLNPFRSWIIHQPLETVLSNALLNSPVFSSIFKIGLTQQDALYYARNMIQSGMGDYAFSIISESLNAAANAISVLNTRANTADYALAIANSIAGVLKNHQLAFFADGSEIGNALLQNLQDKLRTNAPSIYAPPNFDSSPSFTWGSITGSLSPNQPKITSTARINSGFGQVKQASSNSPNFQSDGSIFKNALEFFLSQSNKLQGVFCNGPFSGVFGLVREALSNYGVFVSLAAANSVTQLLGSMDSNAICNQYASAIAEAITNVLHDNNLLQNANAMLITERMESNVSPSIHMKAAPIENYQGSQPLSSSFDTQQNPSFFSEFPSSEVQFPNPELSPINPMGGMVFDDILENPFSFPPSDSIQVPPLRTEVSNKSPEIYPSFEYVNPGDSLISGDNSGTFSDTFFGSKPKDQEAKFSVLPEAEASEDSPFGIPNISIEKTLHNNSKSDNASQNMTSVAFPPSNFGIILEPGPFISGNSPVQMENVPFQKEDNFKNNSTTLSPVEETRPSFTEYNNTELSTLSIIETTTAPTPYATTLSGSTSETIKFGHQKDDIYSSIQTANITPKPGEDSEFTADAFIIETRQSPSTQEPTIENLNPSNKLDLTPSVTLSTIIESSSISAVKESAELQPSFWPNSEPVLEISPIVNNSSNKTNISEALQDDVEFQEPNLIFAEHVTSIASTAISLIHSREGNLLDICKKLNELASVVDIPPLDVCNEIALVDYLLNVLKAVTFILKGV